MLMVMLFHIIIALLSMLHAAYMYLRPSRMKLSAAYGMVALTLASGTYLVMSSPAHMAQACMMGIVYLGIVTASIVATRNKLATLPVRVRSR